MEKFIIFVVAVIIGGAKVALAAWVFMLTVGVIHAEWIPQLNTLGYPAAVLISSLIGLTLLLITWDFSESE